VNYIKNEKQAQNKSSFKLNLPFRETSSMLLAKLTMSDEVAVKYVPNLIFMTFLGIIYIANNYYSERLIRKISAMETELENLRVDYITAKYEFIQLTKYTSIAEKAEKLGLKENNEPNEELEP
jgi:cell division protein FtsL